MDTCVRGFSFMPETNVDVIDLKYVESEELERTWKISRRERLKQQEQKIWEEFVKEEDVLHNISQDDPYQFINQLPEACIKELLDLELQKMKQEVIEEVEADKPQDEEVPQVTHNNQHVVTFVDENDCEMLNIFDDDKDDISGPEEELLNDSVGSPCTVRENHIEDTEQASNVQSPDKISSKSSAENVTNMIESSIYSAKVKELKSKINEEFLNIIEFLERQDFRIVDPVEVPKMMKFSSEFGTRFSRVHAYPLQRQLVELERHSRAPPLGRHVHAQAQGARSCSLLHNLLAAAQMFLKSTSQSVCLSASDTLRTLTQLTTDAVNISSHVIKDLQTSDIEVTCEKLNNALTEYTKSINEYLKNIEDTTSTNSKITNKPKGKKKSTGTWSKLGTKSSATEARLSMYSMERRGHNTRSTSSKDNSSGTSKVQVNVAKDANVNEKEETAAKSQKKSPRNRPLMRAPTAARRQKPVREQDIHTLVETVPCTSNHISREASPVSTPKSTRTPRRKETTPKTAQNTKKINQTPRNIPQNSPKKISSPQKAPKVNSPKIIVDLESSTNAGRIENKKETKDKSKERERDGTISVATENNNKEEKVEDILDKERNKVSESGPASVEVTKILRQLCGGDAAGNRNERTSGAKNAQLFCVTGTSPRQPSTPQLLRILEETIQKKTPKALFPKSNKSVKDAEKYRMLFNIPDQVSENFFQYRTKFVQHMLSSTMYANSAIGKPWEKIGSVSDRIIDELLINCVKEMQLQPYVQDLYKGETC